MVKNEPRNQTSTNSLKTIYKLSYPKDVIETIQNRVFTEDFVRACEI